MGDLAWQNQRSPTPAGWRFLTFLELSAGACLFLEAFRADSLLLPGGLRLAQVAAWFVMAVSLYGLMKIRSIVEPILSEGK